MIFQIEKNEQLDLFQTLLYSKEDDSFDMEPLITEVYFTICLNYLHLSIDEKNHVCQIWGYCPYNSWRDTKNYMPSSSVGKLKIVLASDHEKACFENSVDICFADDWPAYINKKSGAVCIGNPESMGEAVEFLKDCTAVVNSLGELEALWLKPQYIP